MSNQNPNARVDAANRPLSPQEALEKLLGMARIIDDATYAYSGKPGQDPFTVFRNPKAPGVHRRSDVTVSQLPVDKLAFRQAMRELGIGRPTNYDADAAGLHPGYLALPEAGRWTKTWAGLQMTLRNPSSITPGVIVVAASRGRNVQTDERAEMAAFFKIPESAIGETEYEVAEQLLQRMPGFQPGTGKIAYGYDRDGNAVATAEVESPVTGVGTLNSGATRLFMLEIIPQYTDESHQSYVQLKPHQKMRFLAQLWQKAGGTEVAFVTSNAYPSRTVRAIQAERDTPGMRIESLSYGTELYGTIVPPPKDEPPIAPLAAEAYAMAEALRDCYGSLTTN